MLRNVLWERLEMEIKAERPKWKDQSGKIKAERLKAERLKAKRPKRKD